MTHKFGSRAYNSCTSCKCSLVYKAVAPQHGVAIAIPDRTSAITPTVNANFGPATESVADIDMQSSRAVKATNSPTNHQEASHGPEIDDNYRALQSRPICSTRDTHKLNALQTVNVAFKPGPEIAQMWLTLSAHKEPPCSRLILQLLQASEHNRHDNHNFWHDMPAMCKDDKALADMRYLICFYPGS